MATLLFFFLENMALIIALLYLALKAKELLFPNLTESKFLYLLSVVFISFLTFSVMYNPYFYMGMRLDLREVPLYFISYIAGWKVGLLSAIFPAYFRYSFEGPTVVLGILQSIVLPVVIGSLFHNQKSSNKFFNLLNLKKMMAGFLIFEMLKSVWMFLFTPATISIIIAMLFFAGVAVLAMGLITNGESRQLLLRTELEYYSNQDPMTQLPNIRFFKKTLAPLIVQQIPLAIVMMDVDYFKIYNDTHGHQKGDAVLRSLGQLMKDNTRSKDHVARYGGEEFIFCITDPQDQREALMLAEIVRKQIELYPFVGEELQPAGKLTVSMGVSVSTGDKSLDELIGEADSAMYESKHNGRNCVTAHSEINARELVKS
ncbi:diguanylate cyclase [Planococcus kocurii]|uniref:Diguanylate cyclase n=1 Tax=Planococcus kocurii TaxID=1374 RepID=A0ABM5WWG0_9BACL|nr:diguanylate cyclase [Planococcus kocurii]ALS78684.1 diguanylate cyclase [Planococcus kocurii]